SLLGGRQTHLLPRLTVPPVQATCSVLPTAVSAAGGGGGGPPVFAFLPGGGPLSLDRVARSIAGLSPAWPLLVLTSATSSTFLNFFGGPPPPPAGGVNMPTLPSAFFPVGSGAPAAATFSMTTFLC